MKSCDRCQRQQPAVLNSQVSKLCSISVDSAAWSLVGMEIVGPYKKTVQGNLYILTMTYYFSKWIEAYAIPDETSQTIASRMYTWHNLDTIHHIPLLRTM